MSTYKVKISKKGAASTIIGIMIAAVIGVVVTFSVVTETSRLSTVTFAVTNQTYNMTGDGQNSTTISCPFGTGAEWDILFGSTIHLYNSSDCATGEFTRMTDYRLLNNGTSTITLNITDTGRAKTPGQMCLAYQYRSSQYASDGTVRTIMNLLPVLIAIALLAMFAAVVVAA